LETSIRLARKDAIRRISRRLREREADWTRRDAVAMMEVPFKAEIS
jgi:hypothetical protein